MARRGISPFAFLFVIPGGNLIFEFVEPQLPENNHAAIVPRTILSPGSYSNRKCSGSEEDDAGRRALGNVIIGENGLAGLLVQPEAGNRIGALVG